MVLERGSFAGSIISFPIMFTHKCNWRERKCIESETKPILRKHNCLWQNNTKSMRFSGHISWAKAQALNVIMSQAEEGEYHYKFTIRA